MVPGQHHSHNNLKTHDGCSALCSCKIIIHITTSDAQHTCSRLSCDGQLHRLSALTSRRLLPNHQTADICSRLCQHLPFYGSIRQFSAASASPQQHLLFSASTCHSQQHLPSAAACDRLLMANQNSPGCDAWHAGFKP